MTESFIESNTAKQIIIISTDYPLESYRILDSQGRQCTCPVVRESKTAGGISQVVLDAAGLVPWSPQNPQLYTLETENEKIRFGYCDLRTRGRDIYLNNAPYHMRGYIRGIVAHDHPNMTGGTDRDWHHKNITQARKYGFNLVRFHSTIPDEEFVEVADELGLLIHMEIGFSYEYDEEGNKKNLGLDPERWRQTILKYRNHPSVAIFCIGNEMHNSGRKPEAHQLYAVGRELVPHKLIMDNSGWGEYDRTSADVYAQHIAYYFPYRHHAEVFNQDFCWQNNGSMHEVPLIETKTTKDAEFALSRVLNPIRPTLAHEAIHYIDIPDYKKINRKFDDFCKAVGHEYLEKHQIRKPRYMTDLPRLIEEKGIEAKMPDYIAASQAFKKMGIKTYLERLRLSEKLCGFEMLQFADCLKYENKNGIVDSWDDDKFIDAEWMRTFNADTVLLADLPIETVHAGEELVVGIYLSHFGRDELLEGKLNVFLRRDENRELLFEGEHFKCGHGVTKLAEANVTLKADKCAVQYQLEIEFRTAVAEIKNSWNVWAYPKPSLEVFPELRLHDESLREFLQESGADTAPDESILLTDTLDDEIWKPLEEGRTVILSYHRDRAGNGYYWPGTLDRFKPCIWDRGSNLGGIVNADWLRQALGGGRYFDKNLYDLIESGYKINLDHFPVPVNEVVYGADKPVRDRMKGLIHGIKNFLPDDTLRNFCYLFSVKVGRGTLVVSTFNQDKIRQPATAAYFTALLNNVAELETEATIAIDDLRHYLENTTAAGVIKEDVMNHFWEIDNKPVEDSLFWESAQVDLRKL